jgi:CBS-domain-containing membrane protein
MIKLAQRLVAADFMQRDIITVGPTDTLRDALGLMTENHVTGLPAMDDDCRCIGLVTSSDILNYEQEQSDYSSVTDTLQYFDPESQKWETVRLSCFGLEEFGDVQVKEVMSTDLVWVRRDMSLKSVCRRMADDKVHRVLVMDENGNLYGIISAVDVVRVIAES